MLLASVPDREGVVVELWLGDGQFAEVSESGANADDLVVDIYPNPAGGAWSVPFSDVVDALTRAATRLREVG